MADAIFDSRQMDALAAVLDTLVPPSADGRRPGAGELGLAAYVAGKLGDPPPTIAEGFAALDAGARERGAERFAALDLAAREALLREHDAADPSFLPGLVFHTYAAYYQHPRVLEALGLEGRAPWPKGYPLEQADLDALLESVRNGPKRYRDPG